MSYHSDQGRMEREYYTPSESPEGEFEGTQTVYCNYDQCAEFEMEHQVNLVIAYAGRVGTATYTCHRCELDSDHEFDLTDSDFGYDTDEDWRSDK